MSWSRFEATFLEHPKVVSLSDAAIVLHWAGISYACRNLTDGFIPAGAVRSLRNGTRRARIGELVIQGLWLEVDGGWQVHDYLDYNRSREDVDAERKSAKERMAKARNGKRSSPDVLPNNERSSPNTKRNVTTDDLPSPSEKAAGEPGKRFFETTNRGQEVGALVDVAKAHERKVDGGILASALREHPKTAVMDALMQALGRNAADVGTYMKGVLNREKAGSGNTGRGEVVTADDLRSGTGF